MVGTWFGHGQPEDKAAMYIDRMRPDGSWRGEYRTCIKGKAVDQVQTGRWSLDGRHPDPEGRNGGRRSPRRAPTPTRCWRTAPTAQKYLSLGWNFPYTPQRVADDFQMPTCELVS